MILVTGGAGYIGSQTVLTLKEVGLEVAILDNFSRGHRDLSFGDRLIEADLRDRTALDALFADLPIEAVVHFAANSQVGESVSNPELYYDNNVRGTLTLFQAMKAAGVNRLVFSSSAAVYGEPERVPIDENAVMAPTNPYGETKRIIERMADFWCRAYGFRVITLRYFNAAGADERGRTGEDHSPESHLIPLVLDVALGRRETIGIFGDDYPTPDGTCLRDYVHVDDLSQAHRLALERLSREADGFRLACNLGTGTGYSVRQIIAAAETVTGRSIKTVVQPRRAGDPARLIASSERARRELGWCPRFETVDQVVETAWRWHLARFGAKS